MCTAFFPFPEKERKKEKHRERQTEREREREGGSSEFFHAPESIRRKKLKKTRVYCSALLYHLIEYF